MKRVIIFGGRGYIGKHLIAALTNAGKFDVFTFDRNPGPGNHYQGSILDFTATEAALHDKEIAINLVGLSPIKKPKGTSYSAVHVDGVQNIVRAGKKKQLELIIQLSAEGADPDSELSYPKTKGQAEKLIEDSGIPYLIFRPSVVLSDDNELVRILELSSLFRIFPKVPTVFYPVSPDYLSKFITENILSSTRNKCLHIAGDKKTRLFELAQKIFKAKNRSCILIPFGLVKPFMSFASLFGLFGFGREQYWMMLKN